jgi:hypothetical protein
MLRRSPTGEGFRAIFRRPLFGLAEIAWRWAFGFSAAALSIVAFLEYLNTLPISREDLFLLRTRQPALIWQALQHILRGSGPRAAQAGFVLICGLGLGWMLLASLGRAATLAAIRSYVARDAVAEPAGRKARLRSYYGLNFLRLLAALAGGMGVLAAWWLGGAVSPKDDPSPGSAFLVFLTVMMLVTAAWLTVNWFLSLAPVFVATHGADSAQAIRLAADLCRDRPGPVLAVTAWFAVAHGVAFVVASSVIGFPLAFLPLLPAGVVLGGVLALSLLYFVVADFLYTGRLVAYVEIAEGPEEEILGAALPPSTGPVQPERVDQEELILSDLPLPAEL